MASQLFRTTYDYICETESNTKPTNKQTNKQTKTKIHSRLRQRGICFVSPLPSSPLPCPDHSSLIVYTTDTTIVYYRLVSADNLSEIIDATLYGFHEILILTLPRRISILREHPPPHPPTLDLTLS